MTELNDKYLVTQLKSGSLEALGELYNRHRQMVFRTALAIVADQEAASDLLQDVFLRLYRFADHIDPDYGTELRKAVRNGLEILVYDVWLGFDRIGLSRPLPYEI